MRIQFQQNVPSQADVDWYGWSVLWNWNSWSDEDWGSFYADQQGESWYKTEDTLPPLSYSGWYSQGNIFVVQCIETYQPYATLMSNQRLLRSSQKSTALNADQPIEIINITEDPTYVILDLGCTRSMGSRKAVLAFEEAAWEYGITCVWKRCWTKMSFANSTSEWLEWCIEVHFLIDPPVQTTIAVHDHGDIPIFVSTTQMMNLGFDLHFEPGAVCLSCKLLGYDNERLPFSTSRHCLVNLAHIQGKIITDKKMKNAFLFNSPTNDTNNFSLPTAPEVTSSRNPAKEEDSEEEDDDDDDEEEECDEGEALAGRRARPTTKTTLRERPLKGISSDDAALAGGHSPPRSFV